MYFRFLCSALVVSLLLPVACDASNDKRRRDDEDEGQDEKDTDDLVDALVTFIDECPPWSTYSKYEPASQNNSARVAIEANVQEQAANRALTLNQGALEACIAALASCRIDLRDTESPCARVFQGQRRSGEDCDSDQECVDGLVCLGDDLRCGVCGAPPSGGESCDKDPDPDVEVEGTCADGFVCDTSDTGSLVCRAALADGAACDPGTGRCHEGSYCNDLLEDPVCVSYSDPPKKAGDPCQSERGCGDIETGLTCQRSVCVEMEVAQRGEGCDPSTTNPLVWCIDQFTDNICDPSEDNALGGICKALPSAGRPCILGTCADTALCNEDGLCVALPRVDEPCIDYSCADGLICNDDVDPAVCTQPPTGGETCIAYQCDEDSTCNDDNLCEPLPQVGGACDFSCADDLICRDGTCVQFEDTLCAE
jgi:hypothetical protein